MKKIEKVISRDISVLGMYADHIGLTDGLKEWFGWSYSDLVFYFHDNYADLMLAPQEHYEEFLEKTIKKIKEDPLWFKTEQQRFLSFTKQFYTFLDDSKNKLGENVSNQVIAETYKGFYDWMRRYYGLFVLMKWFPIWIENNPTLSKVYAQEMNMAIEARMKAELILPNGRELTNLLLEKISYDKTLVNFFTKQEFFDFLLTGKLPSVEKLQQRKGGFIFSRKGISLTDGKQATAKKILAGLGYEYKIDSREDLKEFKGQTACAGLITGMVRLIMVKNEIANIKEGEILVTSMTTPEYLPAMKKAVAFVTDEGGITCHAAIVAREMQKPCIIGTKIATKVLKDGDLVEVNADTGIVKIIERRNFVGQVKNSKGNNDALIPEIWADSFNLKFGAYPFFSSVYFKSYKKPRNKYEASWKYFLSCFKDGQLDGYLPKKEILEVGNRTINELLDGKDEFTKTLDEIHKKNISAISMCFDYVRGQQNSFESIWPVIEEILSKDTEILFNFDYAFNDYITKIQSEDQKLFRAINSNLAGERASFINEAIRKLRKLVLRNPNNFDRVYSEFVSQFGWFQNSYKGLFKITKGWLKEFYQKHKDKKIEIEQRKQKVDKKYKLLVKAVNKGITFRDDKKKLLLVAVPIMDLWLERICEEKKWNKEEMLWLSVGEILQILKGGNDALLAKAKEYRSLKYRCGIYNEFGLNDVNENYWNKVVELNLPNSSDTVIKGLIGNFGIVTGKVRVILNIEQQGRNFTDGEILVTSMTRPEYLPLMSKAAAFITDEGGVTCHAAIIAREMQKPCIIGTKIATKVLRDGMLVEVNANTGIVKILSDA